MSCLLQVLVVRWMWRSSSLFDGSIARAAEQNPRPVCFEHYAPRRDYNSLSSVCFHATTMSCTDGRMCLCLNDFNQLDD